MQKKIINKIKKVFENQPIERAWLFGSFSRNEENKESDIDIMVRFSQPNNISLLSYIHLINQLSDVSGRKVDLVEEGHLKDFALEDFEQEKILIYERKTKGQRETQSYTGSN
ncbi:MAG: nucleotidyltransferase domain-containing protein [Desulfobacula sp.]|uniref:nucleotidyltransferase family protein n=1 Tax=Desulfobacula sp. TaxID=2593537 RepID=UPI0025C21EDC|nr:nucleotidyltransferase domain-containing protein [Desulfobacula sp.]MCD4721759.1 nucleotidyltransferase domain-containing protein [Desulfobacula sp.]